MNLQRIWDEELINSWVNFHTMLGAGYGFVNRTKPILAKLKDPRRIVAWIATLDLKRCPWCMVDNEITFYPWKCQVRAFVDQFSPGMTGALYNQNIDTADIIDSIDNYKWSKKKIIDTGRSKETRKASIIKRTTRVVRMRSLSKNHDWNTVK